MEILAKIGKQMQPGRCKLVDFQVIVDYFSAPSTAENANDRSWYYQSKLLSSSISLIVVLRATSYTVMYVLHLSLHGIWVLSNM